MPIQHATLSHAISIFLYSREQKANITDDRPHTNPSALNEVIKSRSSGAVRLNLGSTSNLHPMANRVVEDGIPKSAAKLLLFYEITK